MSTNKTEPQALQRMEHQQMAVAHAGEPVDFFVVISRAAADPTCDPAKMRELLAMRKELEAEKAKKLFDQAMAAFQAECPVIEKTKAVMNKDKTSIRFKFAPLEEIIRQVKPLLEKHGFSFAIKGDVLADKTVKAVCIVKCSGHEEESGFQVPIDPEGYMTLPQKFASALTFAKRYAFCNAFGIMTAEEDTNGDQGEKKKKPATDDAKRELLTELWRLTEPVRGTAKDWSGVNQWLWKVEILDGGKDETADTLPVARLREVITKAKGKL